MNCLIIFKSLTFAQSALQTLKRSGIGGSIIKPPVSLGQGSCSHGVQVREIDLGRARKALSSMSMSILGVYQQLPQGRYREILT